MTNQAFLDDPYLASMETEVAEITTEGGVVLKDSIFYPTGGGQPGDNGYLTWGDNRMEVATTIKGEGGAIVLLPPMAGSLPPVGTKVTQILDWPRRHALMQMHTALHLLSVVIPLPVTGGAIGAEKSRLDFDMPDAPEDKNRVLDDLNALIDQDLLVSDGWISEAELDANPSLVKTMSVAPPRGRGKIRMVQIGEGDQIVDYQPCGGTHVLRTGEIGTLRIGKIEKKGQRNRRVYLHFDR
ncbi:MAG: alanyl-tRNA editing protein [Paracoccaceae bacterium]|nr:alanyl-tRNA editing protein [Paracoccaceae bacterium]